MAEMASLRPEIADILRNVYDPSTYVRRHQGAYLLEYVEERESASSIEDCVTQRDKFEAKLEETRDDLRQAQDGLLELVELIGVCAGQLDELDVDSNTRDNLRPIIAKMRAAVGPRA